MCMKHAARDNLNEKGDKNVYHTYNRKSWKII